MTLLELLALIKKSWKLCVILPVACAAVVAVYAWGFMADTYSASVSMYMLTRAGTTMENTVTSSDLSASQMITNDVAELLQSDRVASDTAEELGMKSLKGYKISVTNGTTTRVIVLTVSGENPEAVAIVANQMAAVTDIVAREVMDLEAVNIIDEATTPENPSGPNRLMYTGVAFLAGIFVAIAIVVLMDMLNTRVRTPEEAAELVELPLIGRMPYQKEKEE